MICNPVFRDQNFQDKGAACASYKWFAIPCIWYVGHVYSIWDPTADPSITYTSNVALRILKAIGCLIISPCFLFLGIGFVVSKNIAEGKIHKQAAAVLKPIPTASLNTLLNPASSLPSPKKQELIESYQALWKQHDLKSFEEQILRENLKELLSKYQPQAELKTDPDLKYMRRSIEAFEESARYAADQKVKPSVGSFWMPLQAPANVNAEFVTGIDVLSVPRDGNCLYHAFLSLLKLQESQSQEELPESVKNLRTHILSISDENGKIQALRTLVADTVEKAKKDHYQGESSAFAEIQTWDFVTQTRNDYVRSQQEALQDRLSNIETLLQSTLSKEDRQGALEQQHQGLEELQALEAFTNDDYIVNIRQPRFHGGCLELFTLSQLFHIRIQAKKILRFDATHWKFEGNDPTYLSFGSILTWPLFTLVHTGDHFDAALNLENGDQRPLTTVSLHALLSSSEGCPPED